VWGGGACMHVTTLDFSLPSNCNSEVSSYHLKFLISCCLCI